MFIIQIKNYKILKIKKFPPIIDQFVNYAKLFRCYFVLRIILIRNYFVTIRKVSYLKNIFCMIYFINSVSFIFTLLCIDIFFKYILNTNLLNFY